MHFVFVSPQVLHIPLQLPVFLLRITSLPEGWMGHLVCIWASVRTSEGAETSGSRREWGHRTATRARAPSPAPLSVVLDLTFQRNTPRLDIFLSGSPLICLHAKPRSSFWSFSSLHVGSSFWGSSLTSHPLELLASGTSGPDLGLPSATSTSPCPPVSASSFPLVFT